MFWAIRLSTSNVVLPLWIRRKSRQICYDVFETAGWDLEPDDTQGDVIFAAVFIQVVQWNSLTYMPVLSGEQWACPFLFWLGSVFIRCLLDQINVKRQFLINWRFLMKTKNAAHFRRRVKSILFWVRGKKNRFRVFSRNLPKLMTLTVNSST